MKNMVFIVFFVFACQPSHQKTVSSTVIFKTRSDTQLFFKNVRQIYYDKETVADTKIEVYRFKKRNQSQKIPILNLAIAHNWLYDEAYILVEPNEILQVLGNLQIEWQDTQKQSGIYQLPKPANKEEIYAFTQKIYESILKKHTLVFKEIGQDVFANQEDREVFRKVMTDYLRLVGKM